MISTNATFPALTDDAILVEVVTRSMPVAHSNSIKPSSIKPASIKPKEIKPADDLRWNAVCARDPEHDGKFVFAVASTGIYCRPSCAARRPRRENVAFYLHPDQAEKAGYRA